MIAVEEPLIDEVSTDRRVVLMEPADDRVHGPLVVPDAGLELERDALQDDASLRRLRRDLDDSLPSRKNARSTDSSSSFAAPRREVGHPAGWADLLGGPAEGSRRPGGGCGWLRIQAGDTVRPATAAGASAPARRAVSSSSASSPAVATARGQPAGHGQPLRDRRAAPGGRRSRYRACRRRLLRFRTMEATVRARRRRSGARSRGSSGAGERPVFAAGIVQRVRDRIEETAGAVVQRPESRCGWGSRRSVTEAWRPGLFESVRAGERGAFTFSALIGGGPARAEGGGARGGGEGLSAIRSISWSRRPSDCTRGCGLPRLLGLGPDGLHRGRDAHGRGEDARALPLDVCPRSGCSGAELPPRSSRVGQVRAELLGGALVLSGELAPRPRREAFAAEPVQGGRGSRST